MVEAVFGYGKKQWIIDPDGDGIRVDVKPNDLVCYSCFSPNLKNLGDGHKMCLGCRRRQHFHMLCEHPGCKNGADTRSVGKRPEELLRAPYFCSSAHQQEMVKLDIVFSPSDIRGQESFCFQQCTTIAQVKAALYPLRDLEEFFLGKDLEDFLPEDASLASLIADGLISRQHTTLHVFDHETDQPLVDLRLSKTRFFKKYGARASPGHGDWSIVKGRDCLLVPLKEKDVPVWLSNTSKPNCLGKVYAFLPTTHPACDIDEIYRLFEKGDFSFFERFRPPPIEPNKRIRIGLKISIKMNKKRRKLV